MARHSYVSPKVKVKKSGIDRKGAFALKAIKKDEVIAIWGGFIITEKEYKSLGKARFPKVHHYATLMAEGLYLVSSKDGTLEDDDFFNHSCEPNAGMKGNVVMVAMRDIKKGEEITYDYAMTDADSDDNFVCKCGKRKCRGTITGLDWRLPSLRKKYKEYFSWYISDKIEKLKKKKTAKK